MALYKFVSYGASSRDYLTIRKNKQIFLSNNIISIFNKNNYQYVELYVDYKANEIGIKFIKNIDIGTRKIQKEKAGCCVNIGAVLSTFGITELAKSHKVKPKDTSELIVFSIAKLLEK